MASNTMAMAGNTTIPHYDPGDVSWVLTSTAFVWLMIPGIGYFYSGMSRSKNALSLIMLSVISVAIVSFQWFFWGFSFTYSKTSTNPFIGDFSNAFFRGVNTSPSMGNPKVPDVVFAVYQSMFASFTPALAIGSVAERGRLLPTIIFIFIWTTIVYDPIAYWTWNTNGWSNKMGVLDFAGGTPILYQLADACAGMTYSFVVTYSILFLMDKVPGLSLRVDAETEIKGIDVSEIGELAYYHVDKILVIDSKTHETKFVEQIRNGNNNKVADFSRLNNV
ncbi:ammonium transporter AmtB-like domain-containing protein [Jimgerdemannia flammicorona]|uniref:Ammonium transporter AmtB-like domain-containing protein n=1 Tax=Jimgerdemannia flammicorona TaxID=994334 RepID=A0A433DMJ7_9FUNG|nr:ammonium transporter AmtB-like domain-containing protein [Jimgerdemannia flammicorona]